MAGRRWAASSAGRTQTSAHRLASLNER